MDIKTPSDDDKDKVDVNHKSRRSLPDLSVLYNDEEKEPSSPNKIITSSINSGLHQLEESESGQDNKEKSHLNIQPELEQFLSSELWHGINTESPRHGILINVLDRMRSVLYLLSTFLPTHLVQEKMRRSVSGLINGSSLCGTLLFSDISGFTALSERLAVLGPEGAERLTTIMNRYFTTMLEILSWSGGILLKFAGDATLVYFPRQEKELQAKWAMRAAIRMLRAMSEFIDIETPTEKVTLKMKIGVGTGDFLAASIGSERRMDYAILGTAVTNTMTSEVYATAPGQLIVDNNTLNTLSEEYQSKEIQPGFFIIDPVGIKLDDFEIKAEKRRARGAVPWNASIQAIGAQIDVALHQIQALTPYLAPELVERLVAHARQRRIESEYRPTTVLFCNFVGPEKLLPVWNETIGIQRVTGLLSAYFSAMDDIIRYYGGIVSRIDPYQNGTKLLALFGAPVAHEDDPMRAISAALAMNIELKKVNKRWSRKLERHLPIGWDLPLIQHRIGITHGDTFAGLIGSSTRREYTVMGDDVNLAARLMGSATMGQILISQRVKDVVSDFFVLTPLHAIQVKGKSKPINIYQLEGPRNETLAKRVRERGLLIGRSSELAEAREILQKAMAGKSSLLTIQGPPGIGKSHFADEILKIALENGAVQELFYQCRSYSLDTPYALWSGLLRTLTDITSIDHPLIHQEKIRQLTHKYDLPTKIIPYLTTLMGLKDIDIESDHEQTADTIIAGNTAYFRKIKKGEAKRRSSQLDLLAQLDESESNPIGSAWQRYPTQLPPAERLQMFESVVELMTHLTLKNPIIIFIEDAQWMDSESKELISYIIERLSNKPILVMMAQRSTEKIIPMGHTLSLKPYNSEETTAAVANILISDLAKMIHEQSRGNPLFVEEISRWVQRTRKIGVADLKDILQTSDILQKLVLSSLENYPETQREVIRSAAVIGSEFRAGEVQALLPSLAPAKLSNLLHDLEDANLISLMEAGVDARYAFHQSLVRDIVYQSMPFEKRRELHAQVANYLSQSDDQRGDVHTKISVFLRPQSTYGLLEQAEQAAYHYEMAEQWLQAAQYLLLAGQKAYQQSTFSKSTALANRVLTDLDNLPKTTDDATWYITKTQLQILLGDIGIETLDFGGAISAYESALDYLPKDAPGNMDVRIWFCLALILPTQGREKEAISSLHNMIKEPISDTDLPIGMAMAWLLWRSQEPELEYWLEQCRKIINNLDATSTADCKTLLYDWSGDSNIALLAYQEVDKPTGTALIHIRLGNQAFDAGDFQTALRDYRKAAQLWENTAKEPCGLALAFYRQAEVFWKTHQKETAIDTLNKALDLLSKCPIIFQTENRKAIQNALESINNAKIEASFPRAWRFYEDTFYISQIFHIFN